MDFIKYAVLDLLRSIGIGIVNLLYGTIDVLYDVAHKINSLDFIKMLQDIPDSPFTKIFNAFFILAFTLLLLFAVWKITFKVMDSESSEQPLFELIKEVIKSGVLIFCVFLIFNTGINLGINLSNSIYNNFNSGGSSIGTKMKTAYLSVNDQCYIKDNNQNNKNIDKKNVDSLKEQLSGYADISSANTMSDIESLVRSDKLTATHIIDSGAFPYRCDIYVPGIFNDKTAYTFNYNFLFGIVFGAIFLFAIGFAVLMLGKRQLELAFLMVISPIVIATSIGRKEQRSALYQQLTSLVLQAGALMLLIGLTSIMFNAIQNSSEINNLPYFTKVVSQSVLYLGCAMLLMTGSTSLNRFIGENVSANSGRDMMMAMMGIGGGISTAGHMITGGLSTAKSGIARGYKGGKGIGQLASGAKRTAEGMYHGVASIHPNLNNKIGAKMQDKLGKGLGQVMKGEQLQQSKNPFARSYGKHLENKGSSLAEKVNSKWDFASNKYNAEYMRSGVNLAREGLTNIASSISPNRNISNPSKRNNNRTKIYNYDNDKI